MTWVLLRGLTREARHWGALLGQPAQDGKLARQLARQLEQPGGPAAAARVVALDLPGNGEFFKMLSPLSVRGMVDFAREQLRARGIGPPYELVAMSLGGMVATDWAQQYPNEVSRLVLINTSMRPYSRAMERLRPGNWLPFALALRAARWPSAASQAYAERLIHQLTCKRIDTRDEDLAAWGRIRQSAPVSAANALRQLWAAALFCSAPTPPRCPALVLSSAADRLVDPQCSARVAAAWLAPHYRHPWAGHDLPHDDAGWVSERIAVWLGAGAKAASPL